MGDTVKPLTNAAKGEAEKLGHQVTALANHFPSLAGAAIGAASKTTSSQLQTCLLEQSKTLTESALELVYASKEAGGNPKSTSSHEKVDEAGKLMHKAVSDLTETLEKAGGEAGLFSGEWNTMGNGILVLSALLQCETRRVKNESSLNPRSLYACIGIQLLCQILLAILSVIIYSAHLQISLSSERAWFNLTMWFPVLDTIMILCMCMQILPYSAVLVAEGKV